MAESVLRSAPNPLGGGLRVVVSQLGTTTTIGLEGEWDLAVRDATRAAVGKERARRPDCLVLDLSRLNFMDTSGVHGVIDLERCSAELNIRLSIIPGPRAVQRMFEICQITGRLPFTEPV